MTFGKMHNRLEGIATKKGIIISFLAAHAVLLVMMLFSFPRINKAFETAAFDLKTFGYSYEEALVMLENLDDVTRDFYIFPQLFLLDVLYPFLLALFLSLVIVRLSNLIHINKNHFISYLFVLPYFAMLCDYAENIFIFLMISNDESPSKAFVNLASTLTQLKGGFTTLSWISILVLFIIWIFRRIKKN